MKNNPPKILFKYPSRGRPERFFSSLDSLYNNIDDPYNFLVSCTLDTDDLSMNNSEVIERVMAYKNISIEWGESTSKINAVNRSMPDYDWDIVIVHSDDMVYNLYGFDSMVRVDMMTHFPEMDGLLHYPDQDAKEALATMVIMGRNLYNKFGYIYNPDFKSLWCDNLLQDIAQKLGKYKYCGYQINLHLCPAYGYLEKDELWLRQQGDWAHDEALYIEIKNRGYDLHLLNLPNDGTEAI